ncbi:MAG: alpha/beta hydrolase-fold protein [Oscillospiraceae bacterium]|nr:alpha/beta hydrolase-fold protein [Oscillospiraceae bacterium]
MSEVHDLESSILLFDPQYKEAKVRQASGSTNVLNLIYYESVPQAIEVTGPGTARFVFYAPGAQSVAVAGIGGTMGKQQHPLLPVAEGYWEIQVSGIGSGFHYLEWYVDGKAVLNPRAAVGYGCFKAMNYLDMPGTDTDFYRLNQVPHGTVSMNYYESKVTGRTRNCFVYTPPGYESTDKRYPVLYLQHGGGESEMAWVWQGHINLIMDNLLAELAAEELIIVMNNGYAFLPDHSEHPSCGALSDVLVQDCIPFIDQHYRTLTDRWHRAMAGLSMGGFQTQRTVMCHPERFAALGLFSAVLMTEDDTIDYAGQFADPAGFNQTYPLFFVSSGLSEPMCQTNQQTLRTLEASGIRSIFFTAPGYHEWQVWRQSARAFLCLLFKSC